MMDSTPHPPALASRRSTDTPTLWVSLVAGSVLVHLLLFLVFNQAFLRTARVQVAPDPIDVDFVDPDTIGAASAPVASGRPTTARSSAAGRTKATPTTARSTAPVSPAQPVAPTAPVAPVAPIVPTPQARVPIAPTPPLQRSRDRPIVPPPPLRQQDQPPVPATPLPPATPHPASPATPAPNGATEPSPTDTSRPDQTPAPNSASPGTGARPETPTPPPETSGRQLPPPTGSGVSVVISNPHQIQDFKAQPARPLDQQQTISIHCPPDLCQNTNLLVLQVTLVIDQKGSVLSVTDVIPQAPLPQSSLDPERLKGLATELAREIFANWRFEPAQDGTPLKPVLSDLTVDVQVQIN